LSGDAELLEEFVRAGVEASSSMIVSFEVEKVVPLERTSRNLLIVASNVAGASGPKHLSLKRPHPGARADDRLLA
jgi:hypothetical protein